MAKTDASLMTQLLKGVDGLTLASDKGFKFDRIPFGIPQLDKLTGGGIPKKRFTLLTGQPSGGKSYLAMKAVESVQKSGGTAVWIDTEMSLDESWFRKCGVDPDLLLASQPKSGEEAIEIARVVMEAGVDLVVIDSIAGMVPAAELSDFDKHPMGFLARFVNDSLSRLMSRLQHGSALICINQQRSAIGPVAIKDMPGGKGQVYWNHLMLEVRRAGWIEDKKTKVKEGFDMEVTLKKNKTSADHWQKVVVPFKVDGGIDIMESYMREGLAHGYIKQAGAWYDYAGNKVLGLNSLKNLLVIEQPELGEKLKEQIDATQYSTSTDGDDSSGNQNSQLLK
jgi:recombination protein RecA